MFSPRKIMWSGQSKEMEHQPIGSPSHQSTLLKFMCLQLCVVMATYLVPTSLKEAWPLKSTSTCSEKRWFPTSKTSLGRRNSARCGSSKMEWDHIAPGLQWTTCSVSSNRLITLNSAQVRGTDWPLTSPDLSTLDYHTWKAIQEKLYFGPNPPHDLVSLKSCEPDW